MSASKPTVTSATAPPERVDVNITLSHQHALLLLEDLQDAKKSEEGTSFGSDWFAEALDTYLKAHA